MPTDTYKNKYSILKQSVIYKQLETNMNLVKSETKCLLKKCPQQEAKNQN